MKIIFILSMVFPAISYANGANYCGTRTCSQEFKTTLEKALKGDANSQNEVGEMLHFGKGVLQNYLEAKVWYLRASNQDHAIAPNHIGRLYLNGEGVAKNRLEACAWYKISGERGHIAGKHNFQKCKVKI